MKKFLIFLSAVIILSGCSYFRPDIMLKTPRNYVYSPIKDSVSIKETKIGANDLIEFHLFSNDGFKLIDLTSANGSVSIFQGSTLQYVVENEGTVKLPVLGETMIVGLTIREAETMLEEKYAKYYVKPFVILKVANKRVIVFPGAGSSAKQIALSNNHTTLIELIAIAGGLPEYAKAYKIKVIRGDPKKPLVYLIDLSKISGIALANMVVQPNDIIYVEPRIRVVTELIKELDPILTLISSTLLAYTVYITVKH
jgi:polysaccharide export outer membrane protein